jgi:hypothetical protein
MLLHLLLKKVFQKKKLKLLKIN